MIPCGGKVDRYFPERKEASVLGCVREERTDGSHERIEIKRQIICEKRWEGEKKENGKRIEKRKSNSGFFRIRGKTRIV